MTNYPANFPMNNPLSNLPAHFWEYNPAERARESEKVAKEMLEGIFKSAYFHYEVFLAVALTARGRKKIKQLEESIPEMFAPSDDILEQCFQEHYHSGNLEVDRSTLALIRLYQNETCEDKAPHNTLAVVRAAYPRLYNACHSAGEYTRVVDIYLQQFKISTLTKKPKDLGYFGPDHLEHFGKGMPTDGLHVYCLLLWIFYTIGKQISPLDSIYIYHTLLLLKSNMNMSTNNAGLEINADDRRCAKQVLGDITSKIVPCLQVSNQVYFAPQLLRRYYLMFEIAGNPLDIRKHMETVTITEKELQMLSAAGREVDAAIPELLVPFLLIKQLFITLSVVSEQLEAAADLLNKQVEREQDAAAVEDRVSALQTEAVRLSGELEEAQKELRQSANRERALMGDISMLRKTIDLKETAIEAHRRDALELVELREVVYHLSQTDVLDNHEDDGAISFPYNDLPEGIICFGGHEQWQNKMQEKFPTIRFVPVGYRYDSGILKKAPCIWIQSTFISHTTYSRCVNDARAAGIPTHYFHSLSVLSAARRLVEVMHRADAVSER